MAPFRDKTIIEERFNNNPPQVVTLLEGILSAEQVTAIEAALFPAPDAVQRKTALEAARQTLLRAGVPLDDSAVTALDVEISRIDAST